MGKRKAKAQGAVAVMSVDTVAFLNRSMGRICDVSMSLEMLDRVQPLHHEYVCGLLRIAVRDLRNLHNDIDERTKKAVAHG